MAGDGGRATLASGEQVRPAGVDEDTESITVPVKPLRAVTAMGEKAEVPAGTEAGEVAVMKKSTAWNSIKPVLCERLPLVPVKVTV